MKSWTIPIKTVSEANCSEHWTVKSRRHKRQQFIVNLLMAKIRTEIPIPCTIVLTRISTHQLDDDNLILALKWVRDEISECLLEDNPKYYKNKQGRLVKLKGRCDNDPRIKWKYAQEKGSSYAVKIDIN